MRLNFVPHASSTDPMSAELKVALQRKCPCEHLSHRHPLIATILWQLLGVFPTFEPHFSAFPLPSAHLHRLHMHSLLKLQSRYVGLCAFSLFSPELSKPDRGNPIAICHRHCSCFKLQSICTNTCVGLQVRASCYLINQTLGGTCTTRTGEHTAPY